MLLKIVLIEDDKNLVSTLSDILEQDGYEVEYYYSLDEIEDYIILEKYNLIILDVMMGDFNGFDFLKLIRNEIRRPVIFLTAKNTKEDILLGFHLGADDYVTKPFDNDLLLARIRRLLKNERKEEIIYQSTIFDLTTGVVKKRESINLTNAELEIIKLLHEHKGSILSKDAISHRISSNFDTSERAVVSHIYNIRKKLVDIDGDDPIENKWGVGYLWKEK